MLAVLKVRLEREFSLAHSPQPKADFSLPTHKKELSNSDSSRTVHSFTFRLFIWLSEMEGKRNEKGKVFAHLSPGPVGK